MVGLCGSFAYGIASLAVKRSSQHPYSPARPKNWRGKNGNADLPRRLTAAPEGLQTAHRHFGTIILGARFCYCADWPGSMCMEGDHERSSRFRPFATGNCSAISRHQRGDWNDVQGAVSAYIKVLRVTVRHRMRSQARRNPTRHTGHGIARSQGRSSRAVSRSGVRSPVQ